jgi:hypothetical protein
MKCRSVLYRGSDFVLYVFFVVTVGSDSKEQPS